MPSSLARSDLGLVFPSVADPSDAEAAILAKIEEGLLHHEQGRTWLAEKAYRRVLARHPDHARARGLLALLTAQKPASDEVRTTALARLGAAAADDVNDVLIQTNWAMVLNGLGRMRESIEAYQRVVEAYPGLAFPYQQLGRLLIDACEHERSLYAYERAIALDPGNADSLADYVFLTDLAASKTFDDSMAARRQYNDQLVVPRLAEAVPHRNSPDPDRKLRIGYASADMYQHSGATTWGGFVVNHDREHFHITLYSGTQKEDAATAKFKASCDQWYDTRGWSDDRLALQVARDGIDILVDLASFTSGGRLLTFARRPAPVQLSGWGYATGVGLDCMDYFATDAIVCPPDQEARYVESPLRLPSVLSWVHPASDLPVGHVRAVLGGRPFTFGVFNRMPKLTRASVAAWIEILRRVPGARLLVKNGQLVDGQLQEMVRAVFVEQGARYGTAGRWSHPMLYVETAGEPSRIGFGGPNNHGDHLAAHWMIDVMLDPFPQGGGASAFESLWMGVPIVTLLGDRPSGRIGASLLHQVDLDDFCATDVESYIEKAVEVAHNPWSLVPIRETLRERLEASPALQLKSYTRRLEAGYRKIWQLWCRQHQAKRAEAA